MHSPIKKLSLQNKKISKEPFLGAPIYFSNINKSYVVFDNSLFTNNTKKVIKTFNFNTPEKYNEEYNSGDYRSLLFSVFPWIITAPNEEVIKTLSYGIYSKVIK